MHFYPHQYRQMSYTTLKVISCKMMMLQHFYNESIPHPPSEKKRYQHISFSKKKITEDSGELIKGNKMIKTCSYIQHLVINLKH